MINGLYNSASGMNAELARQDVLANNLANVSTTGFKKDQAVFEAFPNVLVRRINDKVEGSYSFLPSMLVQKGSQALGIEGHGTQLTGVVTDMSDGTYQRTDQPLDLAIEGNALFTVELKDGSRGYTRAGNFSLDAQGKLITQGGDYVLSKRGAPIVIQGNSVVVDPQGRVIIDGVEADTLLLTSFEKKNDLVKRGESIYLSQDGQGISSEPSQLKANIKQGFVENANVTVIKEMVDMIAVMRAYEANQKAIQIQDATLDKAINSVGQV